jgi:hypothetical protein
VVYEFESEFEFISHSTDPVMGTTLDIEYFHKIDKLYNIDQACQKHNLKQIHLG